MKALTLRQPWAQAVLAGGKDIENRSRNVVGDHRGILLIHAGRQLADLAAFAMVLDLAPGLPTLGTPGNVASDAEGILGAVTVTGVHHWDSCQGACSPWAMPGHHHIRLADPVVFPKKIPAKGALGLWDVDQAAAFIAAQHLPEEEG